MKLPIEILKELKEDFERLIKSLQYITPLDLALIRRIRRNLKELEEEIESLEVDSARLHNLEVVI